MNETKKKSAVRLSALPRRAQRALKDIGGLADSLGLAAYLVGGPVRDLLLKRKILDLDFVIAADAIAFAEKLAVTIGGKVLRHQAFQTATVFYPDGYSIDIASSRAEHYPESGALPVVRRAGLPQDLQRRDFTINAMAVGINRKNFGQLFDFYGGLKDLEEKKIRVLHKNSFLDDPTRILRAVRFETRLGFRLERMTAIWLKQALLKKADHRVKPPRYFAEFRKILYEPFAAQYIIRLARLAATERLFGEWTLSVRTLRKIENRFVFLPPFYRRLAFDVSLVRLLALLIQVPAKNIAAWAREVHLTRKDKEVLEGAAQMSQLMTMLGRRGLRPSAVYDLLSLWAAECICFLRLSARPLVCRRIDDYIAKRRFIRLAVNGEDVKSRVAGCSGKAVGEILKSLLHLRIDGKVTTRAAQLKYIEQSGVDSVSN